MNKAEKLDYIAEQYKSLARVLLTKNMSRTRALSEIMTPRFFADMQPGRDFEKVPCNCVEDFRCINKWLNDIFEKMETQRNEEYEKGVEAKNKIDNRITPSYVVSKMHYSNAIEEIYNAIFNIAFELNYLKQLSSEEQNEKITYVSLK